MVTWHLTMKLSPAKCHERATLWKLWRQTRNSSLLPTKVWPLLHVIRGGLMLSLESQRVFFKICFCFVLLYNKSLNDWSLGERWILFPSTSFRETLRFSGNKIHCSLRDQSLSIKYSPCYAVNITYHGLATKHASLAISASKHGGQLVNEFFTYLKDITLNPGYLKGWRIF